MLRFGEGYGVSESGVESAEREEDAGSVIE